MDSKNNKLSIIVKPTHDCNLRCKYCYIEENAEKGKMSEQILSESIEKVSNFSKRSHWIWHGGEPLLMGLEFYKLVKDIQNFYNKKGHKFTNSIQTNGTLITNELLDFIEQKKDFYLGTSLDGPKEIHNKTRMYSNGKGSFDDVFHGLNLIKKRSSQIGGGAICVVNAKNIQHPKALYEFFKSEKINMQFNPLIKSGRALENLEELGISPKQYGKFLLEFWDVYNKDVKEKGKLTINIDPFMEVIGNLGTNKPLGCNYSVSCRDSFISIGPQGDIYPCGRFDGIKEFWMGNVKTHTIEEATNSQINQKLKKRDLESVAGCKTCDFGKICNSGCMHNAYSAGDIFGKDPYCSSYLSLFKKMKKVLDIEKDKAKRRLNNEKRKN